MTVEYEQTKADVTRFWWHHLRTAPYVRRGLVAVVGLRTVLNGVVTFLRWPDRPLFALWTALTTPVLFVVIGIILGGCR